MSEAKPNFSRKAARAAKFFWFFLALTPGPSPRGRGGVWGGGVSEEKGSDERGLPVGDIGLVEGAVVGDKDRHEVSGFDADLVIGEQGAG